VPFWLYVPNLIGYVRVAALIIAMLQSDPGSALAVRMLFLSLALDFIDGPLARKLNMCTQFGDLLDHVCDHVTMCYCVYITTNSNVNNVLNFVHMVVTLGYMAYYGHYFKHSADGNMVTRAIEANNYFNMPALLWNANTCIIPLVKLSYSVEHGLSRFATTELLDILDVLGCAVTIGYTVAVLLPESPAKASKDKLAGASSLLAGASDKIRVE